MQNKLGTVFEKIESIYEPLITQDNLSQNVFHSFLRAAFAKNFEYNLLCNSLTSPKDAFFFTASLRGICEDLIALKYLKEKIHVDREKLLMHLVEKETFEGIKIQESFFKENKPEQIILKVNDSETRIIELSSEIKKILIANGLKGDKEFPSVAQMATDAKLIKLYEFLYYATSKLVHFTPGLLMRLGWAENMTSTTFRFSTKNFNKYYYDFCSYYGAFLFREFYKAFKKELGLEHLLKPFMKEITEILDDVLRMPEIVTFEECNIKPPSTIIQILNKSAHKLSGK